jgi:hypothetical protein
MKRDLNHHTQIPIQKTTVNRLLSLTGTVRRKGSQKGTFRELPAKNADIIAQSHSSTTETTISPCPNHYFTVPAELLYFTLLSYISPGLR